MKPTIKKQYGTGNTCTSSSPSWSSCPSSSSSWCSSSSSSGYYNESYIETLSCNAVSKYVLYISTLSGRIWITDMERSIPAAKTLVKEKNLPLQQAFFF